MFLGATRIARCETLEVWVGFPNSATLYRQSKECGFREVGHHALSTSRVSLGTFSEGLRVLEDGQVNPPAPWQARSEAGPGGPASVFMVVMSNIMS